MKATFETLPNWITCGRKMKFNIGMDFAFTDHAIIILQCSCGYIEKQHPTILIDNQTKENGQITGISNQMEDQQSSPS